MKILHVLTDSNTGGAGILLENLLRHTGLPKKDICVALPQGAAMASRYADCGVQVAELPILPDRSFSLQGLPYLCRFVASQKPDILHTHASLGARLAGARVGVPIRIATRHCAYPVGRAAGCLPMRLIRRAADRTLTSLTVATAEAAADNLKRLGIPKERILLIRNGAEPLKKTSLSERLALRQKLGIGADAFVVGMVGRMVPVKGGITLLGAARILLSRHTGYHFLFIGGGEEEENLRRAASASPLAGHVTFTGEVRDVSPFVNLFDVAVNCSIGTETSCLALSEAMSLGIPCIASDFGGNPEMVRERENGLLFPAGDAAALALRIERLCRDSTLYRRLREGATMRFESELQAAKMSDAYDRLYCRLFADYRQKSTAEIANGKG